MDHRYCKAQQYITWTHTVKPFNLATIKVGDFKCKVISAPFFGEFKPHNFKTTYYAN